MSKIKRSPAKQVLWEISGKPLYKHLHSAFLSYFWKQQADSAKQQCAMSTFTDGLCLCKPIFIDNDLYATRKV
jgi:hypothetical protein